MTFVRFSGHLLVLLSIACLALAAALKPGESLRAETPETARATSAAPVNVE